MLRVVIGLHDLGACVYTQNSELRNFCIHSYLYMLENNVIQQIFFHAGHNLLELTITIVPYQCENLYITVPIP